jgi:hypothetical protein
MKFLTLIITIAFISACATFDGLQTRAVDKLVPIAEEYCANTAQSYRDDFRAEFNAKFGGSVVITCP